MEPAKLVVVPGAPLGELKVHLLGENREAKLVGVQQRCCELSKGLVSRARML